MQFPKKKLTLGFLYYVDLKEKKSAWDASSLLLGVSIQVQSGICPTSTFEPCRLAATSKQWQTVKIISSSSERTQGRIQGVVLRS